MVSLFAQELGREFLVVRSVLGEFAVEFAVVAAKTREQVDGDEQAHETNGAEYDRQRDVQRVLVGRSCALHEVRLFI